VGPTIRAFRPGDERALYDICLLTGASGEDATAMYRDPSLLGEIYVGPYLRLAPSLALVGEDEAGVAGYVLGVADTRAFELASGGRRCGRATRWARTHPAARTTAWSA
jgi:hypothetical protein